MTTSNSQKLLLISLGLVILTFLTELIGNSLNIGTLVEPYGGTLTLLIAAATTVGAVLLLTILRDRYSRPIAVAAEANIDPDLTRFLELIKKRYEDRCRTKLEGRFEITLEAIGEVFAEKATSALTGDAPTVVKGPASSVIRKLFDKKGRVLILGGSGAGKTVLLLKLAIDLLDDINDPSNDTFPLILNLASWNRYSGFGPWLKTMLISDYDLSEAVAEKLLQQDRLILFLDGLDELAGKEWWGRDELWTLEKKVVADKFKLRENPVHIRAECFRILNDYLQVGRKVVICSRTEEFESIKEANHRAPMPAQVRVLDLTSLQISQSLDGAAEDRDIRHHAAAVSLLRLVRDPTRDDFQRVLLSPFYFTLALEVFDREIVNVGDLPGSGKEIQHYLVKNFIGRRLGFRNNEFRKDKSKQWLTWLARFMQTKHYVTFQLSDLQTTEFSDRIDRFRYSCYSKAIISLILLVVGLLAGGWSYGFAFALLGALFGAASGLDEMNIGSRFRLSFLMRGWYWIGLLDASWRIAARLLLVLLFFSLAVIPRISEKYQMRTFKVILFVLICCAFGLLLNGALWGLRDPIDIGYYRRPYQKMLRYFRSDLVLLGALFLGLWFFVASLNTALPLKSLLAEKVVLILTIIVPLILLVQTAVVRHLIVRLCLAGTGCMPIRYVTFLNQMVRIGILEKDGNQWRFRHQNLQDYFANLPDDAFSEAEQSPQGY